MKETKVSYHLTKHTMTAFGTSISKQITIFLFVSFSGLIFINSSCLADNKHFDNVEEEHSLSPVERLDKLKTHLENLKICGGFFRKEEFSKYFQECVADNSTTGLTETQSSSESQEEHEGDEHRERERRQIEQKLQVRADIPDQLNTHPDHGHWKMFENPHVFKNPCLISCTLEKFEMINATGHGNFEKIQTKAEEYLSARNITDFATKASNLTKMCAEEREKEEELLKTSHTASITDQDVMVRAKCRLIIKFGKCLVRNLMMECHVNLTTDGTDSSTLASVSGKKE